MTLPKVEVLLATFNGGVFIDAFLDSLLMQTGVEVDLTVSDDGSTDQTLRILEKRSQEFLNFRILQGPRKGAQENFFYLLNESHENYVSFADQDDVWEPNHLINSIVRLESMDGIPALTFCQSQAFDQSGNLGKPWPVLDSGFTLQQIMTENVARGCTIVMNRAAVELIYRYRPTKSIMHDWWCLLVVYCCGIAIFEPNCEINYRIHSLNSVGLGKSRITRLKAHFAIQRSQGWRPLPQLQELISEYGTHMSQENLRVLQDFTSRVDRSKILDRACLALAKGRFRLKLEDEVALRLLLFVRKLN